MLRRLLKRQRRIDDSEKFRLTGLILFAAGVGNALAILILLIYFWFVCDWSYEHPSPVFYQLNDIMVTVADASPPTGGGGKIHWEVRRSWFMLIEPYAVRKMNVPRFEGSTHGPVMIMCTRDSCERCDRMEKETLSNPAISDRLNEKWTCIRVNANNRNGYVPFCSFGMGLVSYRAFAVYFQVDSLPAFIFIDREGKPVQRVSGYWSADMFGPLLDYMQGEMYMRNITFEEYRRSLSSSGR